MKLISWNIAGKVAHNREQFEALISRGPSIICLQEVRKNALLNFQNYLYQTEYSYLSESVTLANKNNRIKGNLIISKYPLSKSNIDFQVPHTESVLSVKLESQSGLIDIHNAHIPNGSSYGWKKIETFEGIYNYLSKASTNSRILCGDFNSPMMETNTGKVIPFGNDKERWAKGELSVILGLRKHNMPDAFRDLHGYENDEFSIQFIRKGKVVSKRRFDHIFASRELNLKECQYLHSFRENNLSDHSPIEATFDIQLST